MSEDTLWLTPTQAAAAIGISPAVLKARRLDGSGPPCSRVGYRTLRYGRTGLDAWLAERTGQARPRRDAQHATAQQEAIRAHTARLEVIERAARSLAALTPGDVVNHRARELAAELTGELTALQALGSMTERGE